MPARRDPRRIVIMGAAGRDFHNFNVVFRDDPSSEVVAFTAAQIPGIANRVYPPALAGPRYPDGIRIVPESELADICRARSVDEVVFAYSDIEYGQVMHRASVAIAAGADFSLLGPNSTMLAAKVPVIAICAVRTGVGKSQTTRWLSRLLKKRGLRIAVIRHPMPYGDLEAQAVQRFASMADLDAADCSIEEREEYEPHIAIGNIVFAGVDYGRIVARAEAEADVIVWDGGNNDFSFVKPDLQIVLVDPLRPGHETTHHPGEAVLRMADIVVVAKCNSAPDDDIRATMDRAREIAPGAVIVRAASLISLDDPAMVRAKRVIVVDDGPTITHGGMAYGAGHLAAVDAGAAQIIDPRASAVGDMAAVYRRYRHIANVLPAMGYTARELSDLQATINASSAELVVSGTPCDLANLIQINIPIVRARYEFGEIGEPLLGDLVIEFLSERGLLEKSVMS